MITRLFWILIGAEFLLFAGLIFGVFGGRMRSGPEGPVGGILLFIPPILLLILAAIVFFARSETATRVGLIVLGLQVVPFIVGPIYEKITHYFTLRSLAGDDSFGGPQRELAHALRSGDLARVQQALPAAGDLNRLYGGESLLLFGIENVGTGGATVDMIRALIAAGANPNLRVGNVTPLGQALYHGVELPEVLLAAGADPNALDDAGRPVWWGALQTDRDPGLPLVHLLLEHGADLTLRDRESGPVAYAADLNRNWPVVLLLMERGAAWKGEARFGTTFESMVDFEARNTSSRPAELALIQARMARR